MKIFQSTFKNKAQIRVYYYKRRLTNLDESDRIRLVIKPANTPERSFFMNAQEAVDIIRGLSIAVGEVIHFGNKLTGGK